MVAIEVPREYGYVVLIPFFYVFFDFWMGSQVRKAREKYYHMLIYTPS